MALLAAADWAEFSFLRDHLELSDSALSKQLSTLQDAGYIEQERRLDGHRRRVRPRLTRTGRDAFDCHMAALRQIMETANGA